MSEEFDGAGAGPEGKGAGIDPAAMAFALGSAAQNERVAARAGAYLESQRRLADLQAKELAHELELRHWSLLVRHVSAVLKLSLELAIALLLLALVAGIGVSVWNAAHASGFVIESFAVPPDLAERGLTGEVVAGRLLDRLNVVETPAPNTANAAQTVSRNSADDVKVEIPDTGVSIGELYRFLRSWLGNQTQVSGEVVHEGDGLAVTVRVNGKDGATYQGPAANLDDLLLKAAEHTSDVASPTVYGVYLNLQGRNAEARAVLQRAATDGIWTPRQRASAWNSLGVLSNREGDRRTAIAEFRRAQEADSSYPLAGSNLVGDQTAIGQVEAALADLPQALAIFEKNGGNFTASAKADISATLHEDENSLRADYTDVVKEAQAAAAIGGGLRQYNQLRRAALGRAQSHDGGAPAWLAQQPQPASFAQNVNSPLATPLQMEAALQHWPRVIALASEIEKDWNQRGLDAAARENFSAELVYPWLALAKAKTGDLAGAEKTIAATPGDCYHCIRARGMIAVEARQWGRADYWFAKAVHDAPSIPLAYEEWGRSFLVRGKPDAAISQFKLSNQKGPHFADPLEGWGEALMAQNLSDLALAKFEEADKYAPNRGRLHLKWGEALNFAGNKEAARKQFADAAQLDLTPTDKEELTRVAGHG